MKANYGYCLEHIEMFPSTTQTKLRVPYIETLEHENEKEFHTSVNESCVTKFQRNHTYSCKQNLHLWRIINNRFKFVCVLVFLHFFLLFIKPNYPTEQPVLNEACLK